nr:hypothetical protein [Treponema sp. OMZ 791]
MKKKIFLFCFLSFAVITFAKERMSKPEFKIGIERVDEFLNLFNGKKIGLIFSYSI